MASAAKTWGLLKNSILPSNVICRRLKTNYKVWPTWKMERLADGKRAALLRSRLLTPHCQCVAKKYSTGITNEVIEEEETDTLYRQIDIEVKGHDPAVLTSYQKFVALAASELNVKIQNIYTPPKVITRRTLLKSVHIYKKHRVQYEWRTHFRTFELKHLTGSTADTFLEYVQRNLPEGVAMKVTRYRLETLPEHLMPPQKKSLDSESIESPTLS